MREKKEVMRELNAAVEALRSIDRQKSTAEELKAASELVERLTGELNEINLAEAADRAAAQAQTEQQDRGLNGIAKRFSFAKFIAELGEGRGLTGVEAEVAQMGQEEAARNNIKLLGASIPTSILNARGTLQTAGTLEEGGLLIGTSKQYQEALRSRLVLAQAGATYVGGLTGNIELIDGAKISVQWEGENDEVADTVKQFSSRTAKPKRCAISVPISKQLAIQSSFDVDNIILNDFYAAHAVAVEQAAINGSGATSPTGLMQTEDIKTLELATNGAELSWDAMVNLETEIAAVDADTSSMAYITNAKARGFLKRTLKSAGVAGYIWDNNEINGYRAFMSNLVPSNLVKGSSGEKCSAVLFGDWSKLWIMTWGGLDIVVDPYTLKKKGAYEVTLNAYHDVFVRRKEAFAVIKDALA